MEKEKRKRFTKAERIAVYDKCGGHCAYCGREIVMREMQVDHMVPLDLNGSNDFENLFPSCRSCNNYKHSMSVEIFRRAAERWTEVLMRDYPTYRNAVRFGVVIPNPKPIRFYFETIHDAQEDA